METLIVHSLSATKLPRLRYVRNALAFRLSLALLVLFTLMTPRDTLGLKKLFLLMTLLLGMPYLLQGLKKHQFVLVIAVILPSVIYLQSAIMICDLTAPISYLYPFAYLLLIPIVVDLHIDLQRTFLLVGNIMASVIVISAAVDYLGICPIATNPLMVWLNGNGEAQISKSSNAMLHYVVFLNASPALFFNLTEYVKANSWLGALFALLALILTGTRINTYFALVLFAISALLYCPNGAVRVIVVLLMTCLVLYYGELFFSRALVLSNVKATGDAIRALGLRSIIESMNNDTVFWFTGMGFGSEYYNYGRQAYVLTSELSYMELVRQIGIPLFSLLLFVFLAPLLKLLKKNVGVSMAYLAYLIAGVFEPFIFTSTGFAVLLYVYTTSLRTKDNK